MKTALSSGGLGDIIYAIPILRELGVSRLYLKRTFYKDPIREIFKPIKSFMEVQGFEVLEYPDGPLYLYSIPVDYDMDTFRHQDGRGEVFIQHNMRRQFGLPVTPYRPWIYGPNEYFKKDEYSVIHLTERWRGSMMVDWKQVLQSIKGKVYFTGLLHEWTDFCTRYGNVEWFPTSDILEMAKLIYSAKALYCNQSVSLALAQGMGVEYYLERKPGKSNTLIYQPIEHLL